MHIESKLNVECFFQKVSNRTAINIYVYGVLVYENTDKRKLLELEKKKRLNRIVFNKHRFDSIT